VLKLQVHRELARRHCIRLPGVVVGGGCGCGDDAVGGAGVVGGYDVDDENDASAEAGGAEFLANAVCLVGNERVDDQTDSMGPGLGGQDQSLQRWVIAVHHYASLLTNERA
jgi:hypothetical protein